MNTTNEIRELTLAETNGISGGIIQEAGGPIIVCGTLLCALWIADCFLNPTGTLNEGLRRR